jgi:hypothetical protein
MKVTLFRRGRVWWARYRTDGHQVRCSFETDNRKIAEDRRVELEHGLLHDSVETKIEAVSLPQFLEEYRGFSLSRKRPKSHVFSRSTRSIGATRRLRGSIARFHVDACAPRSPETKGKIELRIVGERLTFSAKASDSCEGQRNCFAC